VRTLVHDLLAHAEWADAVFFQAWGQSPARDHEELRRRAAHVADVQRAFRSMLGGGPPVAPPGGPPPAYAELKAQAAAAHAGLLEFAAGLDAAGLARTIRLPFFPDPPCVVTVAEGLV
jgi:hypothetical protein